MKNIFVYTYIYNALLLTIARAGERLNDEWLKMTRENAPKSNPKSVPRSCETVCAF